MTKFECNLPAGSASTAAERARMEMNASSVGPKNALHNAAKFAERPDLQVLVCDSIYAAEAAQPLLDGKGIATSWTGDLDHADWSSLQNRRVGLLVEQGLEDAVIAAINPFASKISVVARPAEAAPGWVLTDAPQGWSLKASARVVFEQLDPVAQGVAGADAVEPPAADTNGPVGPPDAPAGPSKPARPGSKSSIDFTGLIGPVARHLLGEPNAAEGSSTDLRYGTNGSLSINLEKDAWYDFEKCVGGGVLALVVRQEHAQDEDEAACWIEQRGLAAGAVVTPVSKAVPAQFKIVATYPYKDRSGALLYEVCRLEPKSFRQRRPDGHGGVTWSVKGVTQVPYRLPELQMAASDAVVFIPEGEKDVDNLLSIGLMASCNAGGAGKWSDDLTPHFAGLHVALLEDNDDTGRGHVRMVASKLSGVAASVRILQLPGLPPKGDVSDWLAAGGTPEQLMQMAQLAPVRDEKALPADGAAVDAAVALTQEHEQHSLGQPVTTTRSSTADTFKLDDFVAYGPEGNFIHLKSGGAWPSASVDGPVQWPTFMKEGKEKAQRPSEWLRKHRMMTQQTWQPGRPQIIEDELVGDGGWYPSPGARIFNQYRAPILRAGDPGKAGPWLSLLRKLYPDDWSHIRNCFAHRLQRPGEKLNHALVLGGPTRIGKDTLLEPLKAGVGDWNFAEATQEGIFESQFTPHYKSVVLRISEINAQGAERIAFYEKMKTVIAAPPNVLMVNEKHRKPYAVPNVAFVVYTTNHPTDGLFLPLDDERHFVVWASVKRADFEPNFFENYYAWSESGGIDHVVAHLLAVDLSEFRPKALPPRTEARMQLAQAQVSPEDADLASVMDALNQPRAITISRVVDKAREIKLGSFAEDFVRNRRAVPHRMRRVGYVTVSKPNAADGLWRIDGHRVAIYALETASSSERLEAARGMEGMARAAAPL